MNAILEGENERASERGMEEEREGVSGMEREGEG
jgi:hypothetical protein